MEKNGFVTATKLGTPNNFFVAATKNFAAATKRFIDSLNQALTRLIQACVFIEHAYA